MDGVGCIKYLIKSRCRQLICVSALIPWMFSSSYGRSRQLETCFKAVEGLQPSYHAVLSHHYSVARFTTLWVPSCFHSPALLCSCCNTAILLRPWSKQFDDECCSEQNPTNQISVCKYSCRVGGITIGYFISSRLIFVLVGRKSYFTDNG